MKTKTSTALNRFFSAVACVLILITAPVFAAEPNLETFNHDIPTELHPVESSSILPAKYEAPVQIDTDNGCRWPGRT